MPLDEIADAERRAIFKTVKSQNEAARRIIGPGWNMLPIEEQVMRIADHIYARYKERQAAKESSKGQ